jgi:hypothetical protein
MLTDWKREQFIRSVLRKLSHQRVALLLQPGNVWVIEKAVVDSGNREEALRTCHMRGWVEPLANSVPKGALTPDGRLPEGNWASGYGPIYRLTEAGWNVIHRTHEWVVVTCVASILAMFAAIVGLIISMRRGL